MFEQVMDESVSIYWCGEPPTYETWDITAIEEAMIAVYDDESATYANSDELDGALEYAYGVYDDDDDDEAACYFGYDDEGYCLP